MQAEIDAFIAWKKTRENRRPQTLAQYKNELTRFQRFLNRQEEPRHISSSSENDINRYLSEVGKSNAKTRQTRSSSIKEYFKYLLEQNLRPDNPAADIQLAKAPRRSTELSVLTRDDAKRLLQSPDSYIGGRDLRARDKAILFALYSGLKRVECGALLLRDVELEKSLLRVPGRKAPVKLTQEATIALREFIDVRAKKGGRALFPSTRSTNGHLGGRQIWQTVDKYAHFCKLGDRITPETLRSSFALHAIEDRVGFVELIDALGKFDDVWLRQLVDIARPRMAAAATGLPPSRVYPANSGYAFYIDVAAEIGKAQATVFIVDAYLNKEFFDLYVGKTATGVKTRILTNGTRASSYTALEPNVEAAARLFGASHPLELRISTQVHDRHIFIDGRGWAVGQSIKDAARKRATYVIELPDPTLQDVRDVNESVWKSASIVI